MGGTTSGNLGGPNAGNNDAWFGRYDGAGNKLWIRQFGTDDYDNLRAVATDGSGGVYVSGRTFGILGGPSAGGADVWLARYDGAGNQLWMRQFGTNMDDTANAAAPDGGGGVFLAGETEGSLGGLNAGGDDAWIAHYDGMGSQLWAHQLGTASGDSAYSVAPDESGGVYVGGMTRGSLAAPSAGGRDAWLARYDGAGNQLWIHQLGMNGADLVSATASDGSGGVYVSGQTQGLGGSSAGGADAWLARYDGAGIQLYIRQFGTSAFDRALAAAPDAAGGVYLAGSTSGSLAGPNSGLEDAWLARYDGVGSQIWICQFGTNQIDRASGAAPDGVGGVYVGGATGTPSGPHGIGRDAWLARYDDGSAITAYCFGDGSGGACPCGNNGAPGQGCANSNGDGAVISTMGSTSVSTDDQAILASNLLPAQPALLFAGVNAINGGNGNPFGDGLRCAGGSVVRLGIQVPDANGDAAFGPGLAALGGFAPGDVRRFQVWYRDPVGGPCGSGFNLSNGVEVTFAP